MTALFRAPLPPVLAALGRGTARFSGVVEKDSRFLP